MRLTPRKLAVAALLFSAATQASAQSAALTVSLTDTIRTAVPGTPVSFVFTIESGDGQGGTAELLLPPGWRGLTGGGELSKGSRRITHMVAFGVPASASPGRYRIELIVRRAALNYRAGGWVVVPARHSLALSTLESPEMVVGGSPIHGRFLLTNQGNARAAVRVRIRSGALVDSSIVELAPGGSRELPVTLKTDARIGSLVQSIASVSAEEIGANGVVANASFRVWIAPRESYAAAPTNVIGSRIRIIGASVPRGGSGLELSGSGRLPADSSASLEYVARRMTAGHSIFGERDEYRVSVESPRMRVQLGDQIYRLSLLSENGRYARGAHAELRSNGWTLGAFANREHTLPSKVEERAVFLNRDFGGLLLGLNFLDRKEAGGGSILTANTSIRSLPIGTVEAEAGQAVSSPGAEAWMVSARGDFSGFSYSVFRQKSERDYPGSTRGTESSNAFIVANPMRGVRVRASLNDHTRARGSSLRDSSVTRNWHVSGGLTLLDRLTVEYVQNGRDDGSFRSQPRREERLANAGFRGRLGAVSLNGSAALGVTRDRDDRRQRLRRYSVAATVTPSTKASVSVNLETRRGGTLFVPEQRSEVGGGASVSLEARSGSRFSVSAYAREHRLPQPARDATLEAVWDQQLRSGHTMSFRARLHRNALFASTDDDIVRAEYTLPFGLPVGRSRSRGRVSGRIYDVETRASVPGAMVQLGTMIAVTDAKGRFAFSTDSESPALLTLRGSSSTAGLVPVRDLPLTVVPRMGRTSSIDVGLTKAGRLEGRIRLFVAPQGMKLGEEPVPVEDLLGLRGARVELSQGGDVRWATSNGRGEFVFTDLRPGPWSLTIANGDLPRYSFIEGDSVLVAVKPGGRVTSEITVRPRKRKITIVQGG